MIEKTIFIIQLLTSNSNKNNRLIMNKILFLAVISAFILSSCSSKTPQPIDEGEKASTENTIETEPSIQLYPVDGYFSTVKLTEPKVYILDQATFEKNFQPAKTMENSPTEINFDMEKVGAIVLPETPFETTITIDSTSLYNKTLHIYYSINKGQEKRTFTIIPTEIFTFDAEVDAASVSFDNEGRSIKIDL